MPHVKQIESPVGQRHPGGLLSLPSQKGNEFLGGDDARTHINQTVRLPYTDYDTASPPKILDCEEAKSGTRARSRKEDRRDL